MKTTFEYQGYRGSIKVSEVDNCLYGTLLDITNLVTYEAQTVADLRREFIAAVDDYLEPNLPGHEQRTSKADATPSEKIFGPEPPVGRSSVIISWILM